MLDPERTPHRKYGMKTCRDIETVAVAAVRIQLVQLLTAGAVWSATRQISGRLSNLVSGFAHDDLQVKQAPGLLALWAGANAASSNPCCAGSARLRSPLAQYAAHR